MNYHIIPQDKFFESYIEDIYRIHQEDNNVIWVRGDEGDSRFFHTDHPVEYLGNQFVSFREHIRKIRPEDKLFVSWYDTMIGNAILKAELTAPIYVYLMGADFYSQPEGWHEKWLLDPLTRRVFDKDGLFPVWKPWKWKKWIESKRKLQVRYSSKHETVKRIDYLVLPEHATGEVDLVKKLYPGCRAEHRIGTFDQNVDLSKSFPMRPVPEKGEPMKFLLGNSADPSGNHLDAIRFLKKKVKAPFDLYCLLSYGDRAVSNRICKYGNQELGERFHPVKEYMDREKYVGFLNDMDMILMFHNRQQAAGAIMTSLSLGKPVFMKSQSPLYQQIASMGIRSVHDVSRLDSLDLHDVVREAQTIRNETIELLLREYSSESRLNHLSELLK